MDDSCHDRRADTVPQEADLVTARAYGKPEAVVEAHGAAKFWNLEHSHLGFVAVMGNECKPVHGGNCTKRPAEMLPATAAIGAIVDEKKASRWAECGEGPLGALERRTGAAGMEERRCTPCAAGVENGFDGSGGISRAYSVWRKLV